MPGQSESALDQPKIAVYSGLTLSEEGIRRIIPHASVRAPVKQFDLLADIRSGFHVVVIVDGVFHQMSAVSPSEIMVALRRGLLVYGCSSMGALRAAELHPYGMRGHGAIYEWIRRSSAFRDDYPGQIFAVEGSQLRPLSFTYVDFAFGIRRLLARRRIDRPSFAYLERTVRRLYYPDRTLPALARILLRRRPELVPAVEYMLTKMPSQKSLDAVETLRRVVSDLRSIRVANDRLRSRGKHVG